jgi:hypothetical protein
MSVPFVGPSYSSSVRKASSARSINAYLQGMETPGKAPFIMPAWPGMVLLHSLGAAVRGVFEAKGRPFIVAGSSLYELVSGAVTLRGSLVSSAGLVGMGWLLDQLVITDGPNAYTMALSSNTFAQVSDADFPGSANVDTVDAWALFIEPDSQRFFVSALNDAGDIDPLDVASAESIPDNIVRQIVCNRETYLLGQVSSEVWYVTGDGFPLSRRTVVDVGCQAPWSVCKADNAIMFVGQDRNGGGQVFLIAGYQHKRISNFALESELAKSTDLSAASAFVVQWAGETFYVLNSPGLKTTPIYQVSTGTWCDLADLDTDGQFKPFRATHHLYSGGVHMLFDADGKVYQMRPDLNTFNGDARVVERTSPSDAVALRLKKRYDRFVLDCTTGEGVETVSPQVELSYSNDGGLTWSDPDIRSAGVTGQYRLYPTWRRLGMARDRVWRVRFSSDAPFAIIGADWS